jgi:hypothetical protein
LNEERFYRFDVERIGKVVFVQEADIGDARPGPSYLLSLLESVTSRLVTVRITAIPMQLSISDHREGIGR